jgi:predicted DNA-binding transcriptional regulator AlpA
MTDIARMLGCSRQNVRKYALNAAEFPKPIHAGESMLLWHLVEVVTWAQGVARYRDKLEPSTMELAAVTCKANLELQQARQGKLATSILGKRG